MSDYHEPPESLSPEGRDLHRALTSLREEIEAVDWYSQRVELCSDASLRDVLAHNRDEEIEHACMTLEWLRRKMPTWDDNLRTYLFTEAPVTEIEDGGEAPSVEDSAAPAGTLGLGSLRSG